MKILPVILILTALSAQSIYAGPLFDDYLNPVRPGPGTGPGTSYVETGPSHGIGQTFTLAPEFGEIYRIGVRPKYETWDADESVTLSLYESPKKISRLGSYTIDAATSRVDEYVIGDGSHFERSGDRVLFFQLRASTKGSRTLYFELTCRGGDGRVAFQAFKTDVYPGGQATGDDSADLSFECHVKLVADREANLRRFFNERLDISRPELDKVKKAVESADWEKAIQETVKHFHERRDLWENWRSVMQVRIDPSADTSLADLILKGQVRHSDTGKPIPWRKESWWAPVIPDAKSPNHGIDPSPFLWHFDRELAAAYTATGRPEYARAAIDLRIQWILDNPNPKLIYGGDRFPYYHELWNDRAAAARVPGHADLVYARLYNYQGWTDDEKLILFSFFEDNARWLYRCGSGGNWGVTAAKAALDFGLAFPEWKISVACRDWGAARMLEISLEGVRGDGTCVEGSIKYHAMIARRLLELLQYERYGKVKLSDGDRKVLERTLNGMYDHMAHTLQPDGYVVMCGDSWYENYTESPFLSTSQIIDARALALKLRNSDDPVSVRLRSRFKESTRERLHAWDGKSQPDEEMMNALLAELNDSIKASDLYAADAFRGIRLRQKTRRAIEVGKAGEQASLLNRWLLEDAYPNEIRKSYILGELYRAGQILKRPDFIWIASQGEAGERPADASKVYPEAGYFIMRSDFGNHGRYSDARQLFIHNGGWFGSHGHWDLTSVNLYGFGRPLIIDPGQYEYTPPPGIDPYWSSKIHSMLVLEGQDVKREPGPSRWAANEVLDWFDGRHFGYSHIPGVKNVRRRIAYIRPYYFLIDDSAETTRFADWAQTWNVADPNARFDQATGAVETTFRKGGNVLILGQDASTFACERSPGITALGEMKTTIFRLHRRTDNPRFQTLVYPYDGSAKPRISWERIAPDDTSLGDLYYSVRVTTPVGIDWAAFGNQSIRAAYRGGRHLVKADFAVVRMDDTGKLRSFGWAFGSYLAFGGSLLAKADSPVYSLAVRYDMNTLIANIREPDASIAIAARGSRTFVLNGTRVAHPVLRNGFYYPFAHLPRTIVSDNDSGFVEVTKSKEWTIIPDPAAWSGSYLHHETDPGREESGDYVFSVPRKDSYWVEVNLPRVTLTPSDRVEYRIPGIASRPAQTMAAIVEVKEEEEATIFVVNQQAMCGWVQLGQFVFDQGELRVRARNVTQRDGVYFVADAVRLVPGD